MALMPILFCTSAYSPQFMTELPFTLTATDRWISSKLIKNKGIQVSCYGSILMGYKNEQKTIGICILSHYCIILECDPLI